jgi:phosphohistidine swiveling domain-containing protein
VQTLPMGLIGDPVHTQCDAPLKWTRTNLSEYLPGVLTPLTWDYFRRFELSGRRFYRQLGLAKRSEVCLPDDPAERYLNIFYGRATLNIMVSRRFKDRAGDGAGNTFERQVLNQDAPGNPAPGKKSFSLQRFNVAIRTSLGIRLFPRQLARMVRETYTWWRKTTAECRNASLERCLELLPDVMTKSILINQAAGWGTLIAPMFFARLEAAVPPDQRRIVPSLISMQGRLAEGKLLEALCQVAERKRTLESFLDDYGYYGIGTGECFVQSWREDAAMLHRTIDNLSSIDAPPRDRQSLQARHANDALSTLQMTMAPRDYLRLRRALTQVEHATAWREEAKACTLQAVDCMRAVVRRMGRLLREQDRLDTEDDAFFFTVDELAEAPFGNMRTIATWRRARAQYYEKLDIPINFVGPPPAQRAQTPRHVRAESGPDAPLRGTGASAGTAEGIARVILDPRNMGVFNSGDILVCRVTDPSWTPLFALCSGIVADVGGILSHGAVIARELNIPCVVNSGVGTSRISDGSKIRIDGSSGEIVMISEPKIVGGPPSSDLEPERGIA